MYKEKFDKDYQKLVGKNGPEYLHDNSKELVSILDNFDVIKDDFHVFEIGSGGGRNLKYINDFNPTIKLSANDLHRDASFDEMDESIKDKINFYEMDTLALTSEIIPEPIDLLVASDHLMHIESENVKTIMNNIINIWKPKYILLREVKPNGHQINRRFPRLCYEFDFELKYKTLAKIDSNTLPPLYYVQLLQRI